MTKAFSDTPPGVKNFLASVLLIIIVLIVYANTFDAPFVFDDLLNIKENVGIRLTRFTPESLARVLGSDRPLAGLSFALNYYFHADDVRGYHLLNLVIHIITGLLIMLVAEQTLRRCEMGSTAIPVFAAGLWLVHPVHTQSVTYIVQRMNAMATMFYMLALFCYIRARVKTADGINPFERALLYALCLVSAILGLAAKETVATLPIILLLYEWFFFQHMNSTWLKKQLPWIGLVILTTMVLIVFFMGDNPLNTIYGMYDKLDFTLKQRLLTQASVVVYYVSLLVFPFPSRLTLVYDFPLSRTMTEPMPTALAITALVMLCAAVLCSTRKHPLPAFCIVWFLVTLSVESTVIGLDLIFEHRTYLPSIFPLIGFVWLAFTRIPAKAAAVAIISTAIIACGIWTHQRNSTWQSPVRLWQDTVNKSPGKALPYNNLAVCLAESGRLDEAVSNYQTALDIKPDYASAHYNLGVDLYQTGRHPSAIDHLETAVRLEPENVQALNALGLAYAAAGRGEDAVNSYFQALHVRPDFMPALTNLGIALAASLRAGESINTFSISGLSPWQLARIYNSAASDFIKAGDLDSAGLYYYNAVQLDPAYIDGLYNLGLVLAREKAFQQAAAVYARILAISPHEETARKRHAYCLSMMAGGTN